MAPIPHHVKTGSRVSASQRRTKGNGKADSLAQPQKKPSPRPRASPKSRKLGRRAATDLHHRSPSIPPASPKNPHATFLGLPAELRLQIYSHVFQSTLMHVHYVDGSEGLGGEWARSRFIWSACRHVNPRCPLFCANPKWSGLCKESDRCTFRPLNSAAPMGFAALGWTCKAIYHESKEFSLRNTTVSIHPRHLRSWLDHVEKNSPSQLSLIRRITLSGPDDWHHHAAYSEIRRRLPDLEGVAFQGQVNKYTINGGNLEFDINNPPRWRHWNIMNVLRSFDPHVTVAWEGFVWCKPNRFWRNAPKTDKQGVLSIIREGKARVQGVDAPTAVDAWRDEDVLVEAWSADLTEPKRTARWRKWWRGKDTKYFM